MKNLLKKVVRQLLTCFVTLLWITTCFVLIIGVYYTMGVLIRNYNVNEWVALAIGISFFALYMYESMKILPSRLDRIAGC